VILSLMENSLTFLTVPALIRVKRSLGNVSFE